LKICQNLFPPVSPAPVVLGRPCGELPIRIDDIGQNGLIHNHHPFCLIAVQYITLL
jgi:hypothetical protein